MPLVRRGGVADEAATEGKGGELGAQGREEKAAEYEAELFRLKAAHEGELRRLRAEASALPFAAPAPGEAPPFDPVTDMHVTHVPTMAAAGPPAHTHAGTSRAWSRFVAGTWPSGGHTVAGSSGCTFPNVAPASARRCKARPLTAARRLGRGTHPPHAGYLCQVEPSPYKNPCAGRPWAGAQP